MTTMIQLYASYKETLEKQSMGFRMSAWDNKLLMYGERFEKEMMDLSVNIPLEGALDRGWQIMADCFEPEETGVSSKLIEKFWPTDAARAEKAGTAEPGEDAGPAESAEKTE
jgi:V/A-type H+-transporting ATPase subunit B